MDTKSSNQIIVKHMAHASCPNDEESFSKKTYPTRMVCQVANTTRNIPEGKY